MAQSSWRDIDPYSTSGIQLAALMNDTLLALHTQNSGASRPTYVEAGMQWVQIVSGTEWRVYNYDGAQDILIGTIDPTAHTWTPAGQQTAPVDSVFGRIGAVDAQSGDYTGAQVTYDPAGNTQITAVEVQTALDQTDAELNSLDNATATNSSNIAAVQAQADQNTTDIGTVQAQADSNTGRIATLEAAGTGLVHIGTMAESVGTFGITLPDGLTSIALMIRELDKSQSGAQIRMQVGLNAGGALLTTGYDQQLYGYGTGNFQATASYWVLMPDAVGAGTDMWGQVNLNLTPAAGLTGSVNYATNGDTVQGGLVNTAATAAIRELLIYTDSGNARNAIIEVFGS